MESLTLLDDDAAAELAELGSAQLVVGISAYNAERTIGHVVKAIQYGVAKYYPSARAAALVSRAGSIDWWCAPRFDNGSVFAALLDAERGGSFALAPAEGASAEASYEEGTNVVRHRFVGPGGEAWLTDALAWPVAPEAPGSVVLRLLEGVRGALRFAVRFAPRPEYAEAEAGLEAVPGGVVARWSRGALWLLTPAALRVAASEAVADLEVGARTRVPFVLTHAVRPDAEPVPAARCEALLDATRAAWRAWDARTRLGGSFREAARWSALVLRLLLYEPTGAVVASPTTSLPERLGGVRNWDYRYSWVRDSAFVVQALFHAGHPRYAESHLHWLLRTAEASGPELRVLYTVDGGAKAPERELPPLEGYRGSRPVRVGNAAAAQVQHDIYGELLVTIHERARLGAPPEPALLRALGACVDRIAERWREPDQGFWEVRSEPRHHVLSKAMAWAALERGVALSLPGDRERWARERDACRGLTLERGWSDELGAFQMAFEYPRLDAATLLLPLIGFVEARDPRMVATVARIERALTVDGLVRRYADAEDGLPAGEGAFTCCTFWLVDNLALQGRVGEARALFERALARASPLGLFSEEVEPATGELLGHYPQALPHLGLLHSAFLLAGLEEAAEAPGRAAAGGAKP